MKTKEEIGAMLKKARKEAGLTQNDVCTLIEMPQSQFASIEGGRCYIKVDTLMRILDCYGLEIAFKSKFMPQ